MADSFDPPYQALHDREIRVLCLEPGIIGTPLHGTFEYVTLPTDANPDHTSEYQHPVTESIESAPSAAYEAISYAWGDAVFCYELHLGAGQRISITESLHGALQHLRRRDVVRVLWADAVCINQGDAVEKSAQVTLMAEIYGAARAVLIWLDQAMPFDALAFRAIQVNENVWMNWGQEEQPFGETNDEPGPYASHEAAIDVALARFTTGIRQSDECPCCQAAYDNSSPALAALALTAIGALLSRAWFSRLWTVQEIKARDQSRSISKNDVFVHSGSHQTGLKCLVEAFSMVTDVLQYQKVRVKAGFVEDEVEALSTQLTKWDHNLMSMSRDSAWFYFWTMYQGLVSRECTDPRDRVFAIRSFMQLEHLDLLKPDYEASKAEIYRRFTIALTDTSHKGELRNDHPWMVPGLVGTEKALPGEGSGPSWVPDLHHLSAISAQTMSRYGLSNETQFEAQSSHFERRAKPGSESVLEVRGRCFGTVLEVFPASQWPTSISDDRETSLDELVDWYGRCKDLAMPALSSLHPYHAAYELHRLLTGGAFGESPRELQSSHELTEKLLNLWTDERESLERKARRRLSVQLDRFSQIVLGDRARFAGKLSSRVLCDGKEDIGCVPRNTCAGDSLCIFAGSPYPFAIRSDRDEGHCLLGDAYTINTTLSQALGKSGGPPPTIEKMLTRVPEEVLERAKGRRLQTRGNASDLEASWTLPDLTVREFDLFIRGIGGGYSGNDSEDSDEYDPGDRYSETPRPDFYGDPGIISLVKSLGWIWLN